MKTSGTSQSTLFNSFLFKGLFSALILLATCTITFANLPGNNTFNSNIETEICDTVEPLGYGTKVKVTNRTDWSVKVYIDGYYSGRLSDDTYGYFFTNPGYHRVTVRWSSGYYEYYDFYVCNGCTHKIWTSDYDY